MDSGHPLCCSSHSPKRRHKLTYCKSGRCIVLKYHSNIKIRSSHVFMEDLLLIELNLECVQLDRHNTNRKLQQLILFEPYKIHIRIHTYKIPLGYTNDNNTVLPPTAVTSIIALSQKNSSNRQPITKQIVYTKFFF